MKDITPGAIVQAAIEMYPKAGPATRNRQAIAVTQAVINHASKMDLCAFVRVERFKAETKVRKPATLQWVQKFAAHALPHQAALAWFMFQTGARVSEALRVKWDDVDLQARTVLIGQRKTKSERVAHLPPETFTAIANLPRDRKRVFLYVTRMGAYKAWTTACKRAGIERLPYHSCRHGFATGLLQAGYDVVTVAKAGGWKNARQVLDTYGHANDDPTITDALSGTAVKIDTPVAQTNTRRTRKPIKIGPAA